MLPVYFSYSERSSSVGSMSGTEYDHVVVGAGIVGSWAALELARLGQKVLLIEQFSETHTRGSSHGQSRLTRCSYKEDYYAEMVPFANTLWRQAEKEAQTKLMETIGNLCIFRTADREDEYKACVTNMKKYSSEGLDLNNTREDLFDSKLCFKNKPHALLFDHTGGVLYAHRAVPTVQELFKKSGGHLWSNCPVSSIVPRGEKVGIHTPKGLLIVPSVVVCAGTWTKQLLCPRLIPSLPLQPTMVKVYYWREKMPGAYSMSSGFPTFTTDDKYPLIYGFPCVEYPGLCKVCVHGGSPCDPDKRDQTSTNLDLEQQLKTFVSEHLPLLENEPAVMETCMYTVTPDEDFIIDRVPNHKNIVIGAGFSGTGFKTSPAVGRLLSEIATGKKPFMDISHFSLERFKKT